MTRDAIPRPVDSVSTPNGSPVCLRGIVRSILRDPNKYSGLVFDLIYASRHALRLGGLAVLAAGLGVAIAIDSDAGLGLVVLGAVILALVQPLLLARMRSRQARRRAPRNGHGPGADTHDVDLD